VNSPEIRERHLDYENKHQKIHRIKADFGAFVKEYFVVDFGVRVGLIVADNDSILLVRQYRLLIDRLSWEIPGGKVEPGETSETAAIRECLEETEIKCGALHKLLHFLPGLDTLHNPTDLFYTKEFVASTPRYHQHEVVAQSWVPLEQCLTMIQSGDIVDSLSILGLLSYYLRTLENA